MSSKMLGSTILRLTKHNLTKVIPIKQFSNLRIQNVSNPVHLPILTNVSNVYNPWMYKQNNNINLPQNVNKNIDLPNGITILPQIEPVKQDIIQAPAVDDSVEKQAVTMIVIRRKKMKKHKLKKLRKRMRFEWAKRRQRREMKKEKAFQAELIQQCKTAEKFSAEEYVNEKLKEFEKAKKILAEVQELQKVNESSGKI